jgi:hypothetical protein
MLHLAVLDAHVAGMSVREAAAALRVPKSTVARHWREGHRCVDAPPVWGTADEYLAAERAVWAHAPERITNRVPYEWSDVPGGGRSIQAVPRGAAIAR